MPTLDRCSVYRLRFPSGKIYVGLSSDPPRRWAVHRSRAKRDGGGALYAAIRKYGWKSVVADIVFSGTRVEAIAEEIRLIAEWGTIAPGGYNMTAGGEDAPTLNPVLAAKQGESLRKRWATDPEYRSRMVAAKIGKVQSASQIAARAAGLKVALNRPEYRAYARARTTGRKFINDGTVTRLVFLENGKPPEGWVIGACYENKGGPPRRVTRCHHP